MSFGGAKSRRGHIFLRSSARERSDRAGGGCGRGIPPSHGRDFFKNESLKIAFVEHSIKEEINAMKSQDVNFQKPQKLLASRAGSSKQTKARTVFT